MRRQQVTWQLPNLRNFSLAVLVLVLVCLPLESIGKPYGLDDFLSLAKDFKKGKIKQDQFERDLEREGVSFQLTENVSDRLGEILSSETDERLLDFITDCVAPLQFTEMMIPQPAGKMVSVEFSLTNVGGKCQQKENEIKHYDVYMEVLGVNLYHQGASGPGGEEIKVETLKEIALCDSKSYRQKSEIEFEYKDFIVSNTHAVLRRKDQSNSLRILKRGQSRAYQFVFTSTCPYKFDPEMFESTRQSLFVRFVIPYQFRGKWRYVRSDSCYRISCSSGGKLSLKRFSEAELLKHLVEREPNGYVIKNAFERPDAARKALMTRIIKVVERNARPSWGDVHAVMALGILGFPEATDPTERFMELLLASGFIYPDRPEDSWNRKIPYPVEYLQLASPFLVEGEGYPAVTKREEQVLDPLSLNLGDSEDSKFHPEVGEEAFADDQLYPLISALVSSNSKVIPRLLEVYRSTGDEHLYLPTWMAMVSIARHQRPEYVGLLKDFVQKKPADCKRYECGEYELARQILKVIFKQ